jgi:hypothetical protein
VRCSCWRVRLCLTSLALVVLFSAPGRASAQRFEIHLDLAPAIGAAGLAILGAATVSVCVIDVVQTAGPDGRQRAIGGYEIGAGVLDLVAGAVSWIVLSGAGPEHRDMALGAGLASTLGGALLLALGISALSLPNAPSSWVSASVTPTGAMLEIAVAMN